MSEWIIAPLVVVCCAAAGWAAGVFWAARRTVPNATGVPRLIDLNAATNLAAVPTDAEALAPSFEPQASMIVAPDGSISMSRGGAAILGIGKDGLSTVDALSEAAGDAGAKLARRLEEFFATGAAFTTVLELDDGRLIESACEVQGFSARITLADNTDALLRLRAAERAASDARADAEHLRLALDAMDAAVWAISPVEEGAWIEVTESGIPVDAQRRLIAAADQSGPRRVTMDTADDTGAQTYSVDYLYKGVAKMGLCAHGIDTVVHTERLLNRLVHTMSETFAHLSVGLMIFDERGRLTLFNPSIVQIFEEKSDYLATRPRLGELLDRWRRARKLPERLDYADWRAEILRAGEREETNREERWHMPDARTLMVLIRHHPSGGLAIVVEDITESISLRRSKASERAVQAVITNHLNEGLAVIGPDGRIRTTNDAFRRIWSLNQAEVLELGHVSKLTEAIASGDAAASFWADLRAASTNRAAGVTGERFIALADGRHLKARISTMPDGSTLAVFTDVTASETISSALKERNEALERADEMRNALVDQISHQMRNPLNTVSGFAQMLGEERLGELNESQKSYVEGIIEASGELAAAISEMSDLISIGADPPGGEIETFDPARALADVAELALTRVAGDPSRIYIGSQKRRAEFSARRVRVRQIMFNLMIDALTKAPEGEVVRASAIVDHDQLTIEYRHSTTPECTSHGLALSLARRFVKLCRGDIEIEAEDGVRLIRVRLPEADEAEAAPATVAAAN